LRGVFKDPIRISTKWEEGGGIRFVYFFLVGRWGLKKNLEYLLKEEGRGISESL